MYIIMDEIMSVETPPVGGELNFAANKEAYERYFINVAGILAANNQFDGPFLENLNKTLETFGLVLTSRDSIEDYAMRQMVKVAAEGQRLRNLDRTRYINEFRDKFREGLVESKQTIDALKKQLEENAIEESVEAQRLENALMRDLESPQNDYFFDHLGDTEFRSLMDNELPHGIFTPEGTPKKKKRRREERKVAGRNLNPELGGASSLKPESLRF